MRTGMKTYWKRNEFNQLVITYKYPIGDEKGDDISLDFILLHELGHALGLSHANDPKDFMYPQPNEQNKEKFKQFSGLEQLEFEKCLRARSGLSTIRQKLKIKILFDETYLTKNQNCLYKHVYGFGLQSFPTCCYSFRKGDPGKCIKKGKKKDRMNFNFGVTEKPQVNHLHLDKWGKIKATPTTTTMTTTANLYTSTSEISTTEVTTPKAEPTSQTCHISVSELPGSRKSLGLIKPDLYAILYVNGKQVWQNRKDHLSGAEKATFEILLDKNQILKPLDEIKIEYKDHDLGFFFDDLVAKSIFTYTEGSNYPELKNGDKYMDYAVGHLGKNTFKCENNYEYTDF